MDRAYSDLLPRKVGRGRKFPKSVSTKVRTYERNKVKKRDKNKTVRGGIRKKGEEEKNKIDKSMEEDQGKITSEWYKNQLQSFGQLWEDIVGEYSSDWVRQELEETLARLPEIDLEITESGDLAWTTVKRSAPETVVGNGEERESRANTGVETCDNLEALEVTEKECEGQGTTEPSSVTGVILGTNQILTEEGLGGEGTTAAAREVSWPEVMKELWSKGYPVEPQDVHVPLRMSQISVLDLILSVPMSDSQQETLKDLIVGTLFEEKREPVILEDPWVEPPEIGMDTEQDCLDNGMIAFADTPMPIITETISLSARTERNGFHNQPWRERNEGETHVWIDNIRNRFDLLEQEMDKVINSGKNISPSSQTRAVGTEATNHILMGERNGIGLPNHKIPGEEACHTRKETSSNHKTRKKKKRLPFSKTGDSTKGRWREVKNLIRQGANEGVGGFAYHHWKLPHALKSCSNTDREKGIASVKNWSP